MRRAVPSSVPDALRLARRLGWEIRPCHDGWKLRHPDGGSTTIHGRGGRSGSDWRVLRNVAADLYRTSRPR